MLLLSDPLRPCCCLLSPLVVDEWLLVSSGFGTPQPKIDTKIQWTLRLNAGNAAVSDLHGEMDLQLNAGNLTVSGAQVPDDSSLRTDAANITANLSMTPTATLNVQVNAGSASLTLPANTPARLDARVNVGSMSVTGWSVPVTHPTPPSATASGNLGADATGQLQVQVNVGAVTLRAR